MLAVNVRRRTPKLRATRDGGLRKDKSGRGGMYGTVRLAGVSAILAAAFVLATEERGFTPRASSARASSSCSNLKGR
jgi:hypothetical protein